MPGSPATTSNSLQSCYYQPGVPVFRRSEGTGSSTTNEVYRYSGPQLVQAHVGVDTPSMVTQTSSTSTLGTNPMREIKFG